MQDRLALLSLTLVKISRASVAFVSQAREVPQWEHGWKTSSLAG